MKDTINDLLHSPTALTALILFTLVALLAILAPVISPYNPFDLSGLSLTDALNPPAWVSGGSWKHILGTDSQGRDLLSAILYGSRISLTIGICATLLSVVLGVIMGLLSGYLHGFVDTVIMRLADVQYTIPSLMLALVFDGVFRALFPREFHDTFAMVMLILVLGLATWPTYARVVRSLTLVEEGKDYVASAKMLGLSTFRILIRHIVPNTMRPVLVLCPVGLLYDIIGETTLSFLGVGMPEHKPSLGVLMAEGFRYMLSGEWWIVVFTAITLATITISVNLFSDWIRDILNPKRWAK